MRTITKSIYDVIVEEANQKTDELNRKIQEMHKLLEEQKRQKEQVAKEVEAQKQKAAKERKKAEQEKKTLIKTLVLVANHSVEMTARLLNVSVDYVKVVMKEK